MVEGREWMMEGGGWRVDDARLWMKNRNSSVQNSKIGLRSKDSLVPGPGRRPPRTNESFDLYPIQCAKDSLVPGQGRGST